MKSNASFVRGYWLPVVAVAAGVGAAFMGFERHGAATPQSPLQPAASAVRAPATIALPPEEEDPSADSLSEGLEWPHPGPGPNAEQVPVGQVPRASGPLARTVGELNAASPELTGVRARVRAVVVKSTSGVLGRTFLHVRDGSGDASIGSNDLAVTTAESPAVGTQVVLEGTIEVDKDFGSGYRYRVLLADAVLVAE